jgi:hypothetical protein
MFTRIDHFPAHKKPQTFTKLVHMEYVDYNGIELESTEKFFSKKHPSIWNLNNSVLNSPMS